MIKKNYLEIDVTIDLWLIRKNRERKVLPKKRKTEYDEENP